MKKTTALIVFLLMKLLAASQLQSVGIQNYQSCGSATLIASAFWGTGTVNPVTLYFEKQNGTSWFTLVGQVYTSGNNYIIITPSDISSATTYRVRGVDMVTLVEKISPGIVVNPATWGNDRGTANPVGVSYWGSLCDNSQNYLELVVYYDFNGRPPFTIAYKKQNETNYTVAGTFTWGTRINGIEPGPGYNVRVTDFCGKVSNINVNGLQFLTASTITQNATTCNNGKILVGPNADQRYKGIPPYTYALKKVEANMGNWSMVFGTTALFDNLAPGDYYTQVKDACGRTSTLQSIRLGAGFTYISTLPVSILPGDSCVRTITVNTANGTAPFQYGIRYIQDTTWSYQSSNVFTNLSRNGVYFFKAIDACGAPSDSSYQYATFPEARVDSMRFIPSATNCVKDVKVFASGGYKPYQYGISRQYAFNYVYQSSDTFKNLDPGMYEVKLKDRCGREWNMTTLDATTANCDLRTTPGDFESSGTVGCPNLSGNSWIDLKDDNNELLFSINPRGNTINNVCYGIRVVTNTGGLRSSIVNSSTTYFLDRNFYIEPQQPVMISNPVSIRIYFTALELSDMITYLSQVYGGSVTIANLRILKKKGPPVDLDVTNDGGVSSSQFTFIQPTFGRYGYEWYMEFDVNDFSEFNPIGVSTTPLPLKLVSFTASAADKATQLQWTTTNEENMKEFVIEWSRNGLHYESIGVMAAKNLSANVAYSFVHASPIEEKNFYRLKMVDKNGKQQYSQVVMLVSGREQKLLCLPNPVNDVMTIVLPQANSFHWLRIIDVQGRIVMQRRLANNVLNVQWNMNELKTGSYLLQAIGDKVTQTVFVKQ